MGVTPHGAVAVAVAYVRVLRMVVPVVRSVRARESQAELSHIQYSVRYITEFKDRTVGILPRNRLHCTVRRTRLRLMLG